jgi:hypothetical protein
MFLGTFGFLILLLSPAGGPRTFIGFGALLASSLILISTVLTEYNVPGIWQCGLLFIPAYTMITFAAIYGNATKAQKDYEKHIAERLSDDLKEVIAANPVENLIIEGDVGYAPLVRRMVQKRYRLLGDLVPIHLASDETRRIRSYGIGIPRNIGSRGEFHGLRSFNCCISPPFGSTTQ